MSSKGRVATAAAVGWGVDRRGGGGRSRGLVVLGLGGGLGGLRVVRRAS